MAPIINVRNVYHNIFKNPAAKKFLNTDNAAKGAATLALVSTLSKDALGCYIYVKQSFNNKEIPDSRRHFVTALDLSNGICNVAIPLVTGPLLNKHSDKIFNKLFGKYFDDEACKNMSNRLKHNGIKISEKLISDKLKNTSRNAAVAGFGVITMLLYSQLLVKRMITPTLSTPLADVFKPLFVRLDERKNARLAAIEEQKKNKCDACLSDEIKQDTKISNDKDTLDMTMKENPFKSNIYVISSPFTKFDKMILQGKNYPKQV